jgi:hypothetical protein
MKISILITTILISVASCFGQDKAQKETNKIVEEGKKLYKSEMASWYGTDLFLEKFSDRRSDMGGYFSYNENETAKCIIFSKNEIPKVIGTIVFDSTYNVKTAQVEGLERDFTKNELDLYTIRKEALATITSDTLFKTYQNSILNLVPIITEEAKKVYVLTGPTNNGVVLIGNDYLLRFDKGNNLIGKKRLHKNIIQINYGAERESTTMHSHLPETGDFITSTDICTIMLYEKFAGWNQHLVISKNYVSIWDCKSDLLSTLTKNAWDNINKAK